MDEIKLLEKETPEYTLKGKCREIFHYGFSSKAASSPNMHA
jgi:hypothetical protein